MEREIADLGRSEVRAQAIQEREQKAIARAEVAEKRLAALDGELRQAQASEVTLEGAAGSLLEELGVLRAENERLCGIVLRQHATIDEMDAQGAQIVAKMDEIVGDQDDDRPRRRRR